ncbi:MAG: 16S rRNA (cytidine(1402)-2'-O)-methyltransferase [Vicinamibacterales bacterium]
MPATLFVVATPIGNLEDMTFRAVRVLGQVALIAAEDTRRTRLLLQRYGIKTPTTSLHEHNEERKLPGLIDSLEAGSDLALVSDAGTPGVSDPGFRLVRAAIERGIRVEVLPGASAVLTALGVSGFPADQFVFLGFPPSKPAARRRWLESIAPEERTVVFFEAPHRVRHTLSALLSTVGDRPIAVGRELTKLHEEVLRGTVSSVLARLGEAPRGEFTIVIGPPARHERKTMPEPAGGPDVASLWQQFQGLVSNRRMSRRAAIARVASDNGLQARVVYSAIERYKTSARECETPAGPGPLPAPGEDPDA